MIVKEDDFWLRKPLVSDAKQLYSISQNQEVMKYYGTPPFATYEEAREEIHWYRVLETTKLGFRWIITDTNNLCIGSLGVFNFDPLRQSVEVSYQLQRIYWGRGIMTRAITHMLKYCLNEKGYRFVIAYVHKDNIQSLQLVERVGFERVDDFVPKDQETERLKDCHMYIYS